MKGEGGRGKGKVGAGKGKRGKPERAAGNWAAVVLAAPGCLLAAASVVALTMAVFGRHPMWPHQAFNLAEAAAVRDEAEVVRLIEQGEDPNTRYAVQPGLLFDAPISLTPLEAAVAADDAEMIRRLLTNGASMDAVLWTHLRCIADGDDAPSMLDRYQPAGALLRCDGVSPPWRSDAGR